MKILLTGACGFTGRHFAQAALQAQHQVVPLRANLTDPVALAAEVAQVQPQAVVHLAAISFVGHADDAAFYAVNTVGTTHLLSALAALASPLTKVLIASSANIYGNCQASPIAEDQPPGPLNHYAASKMAMEAMAQTFAGRLPLVIARPFNYTGSGQALSFLIPKLVSHFARKAPVIELGNLDVEREFNDVAMVCHAYLQLLSHGQPGQTYNVCTGVMYSLRQVVALLQDITGHTLQVKVNPALVRANELRQLCGQPARINNLLKREGQAPAPLELKQTLVQMLAAIDASSGQWAAN